MSLRSLKILLVWLSFHIFNLNSHHFAMDQQDRCAIIMQFDREGMKPTAIHQRLTQMMDACPWLSTVSKWSRKCGFRANSTSKDAPRSGRFIEVHGKRLIGLAERAIAADPSISSVAISQMFSVSNETAKKIVTEHLKFHKLLSRWVDALPDANRQARVEIGQQLLGV